MVLPANKAKKNPHRATQTHTFDHRNHYKTFSRHRIYD